MLNIYKIKIYWYNKNKKIKEYLIMTRDEWLEKLEKDQTNRYGLGMYVLDTFNEDIAELLEEHDNKLLSGDNNILIEKAKAFDSIKKLYEENIDVFSNTSITTYHFIRELCNILDKYDLEKGD